MFLSLRSKNLNAKIKEINVLLNFSQMFNASPWLHGIHQNCISFFAKLKQTYRYRWLSRPQLSEFSDHPLTLEEEERRSNFYIVPE